MKRVLLTIDTEGHDGKNPVSHLIWGKTENGEYGIKKIIEICSEYNIKAVFFVDLAECFDYGYEEIKKVVLYIKKEGHDVGVHIHPDHMADKKRLFMWEYTKEEQREIIEKCTRIFEDITGEKPTAFRAGKYSADYNTLDIISDLGYKYDFSQFFGQKWCGLSPALTAAMPKKYKGLIEIPVTIYKSLSLGGWKRYDKVDAIMNWHEYKKVMNNISKNENYQVISLFYHSFSMLDWMKNPNKPVFNKKREKVFRNCIKYIKNSKEYRFIELKDLADTKLEKLETNEKKLEKNNIEKNGNIFHMLFYSYMRLRSISSFNNKARGIVYLFHFVILLMICFILYFNSKIHHSYFYKQK